MESTEKSNKGVKIFAGVLALAVLAGAYLYFQPNKDNLPPKLVVEGQTTQGFLKAQYLDFLTPTKEDELKFDTNVSYWKTAQVTPAPLAYTATNQGQHYLYWDGELGSIGTFKDLVENANPVKAKMLFGAKWDPVNKYFLTTPHNYYKKVDENGNTLTKVLDGPAFETVEMTEGAGVVFASAGDTEIYGFKDGRTFADNPYGICDANDVKVNGWHLFASHTASLTQLFKDCYEGEIVDAYEQTSVDPVAFKRITDFDKSLKYSMLWVNKGTAATTWDPADGTEPVSGDHSYSLFGDKLTVDFNDDTQEVYQLKLEPSTLQLVRNTKDSEDTYIEILTATEEYIGMFEFDAVTKELVVNLKSNYEDTYKVVLGDYSDQGLSKKTLLVGAVEKLEAATLKSKTVTSNDVKMTVSLPKGTVAKYVREMHLTGYDAENKEIFAYVESYEKEMPVTTSANVEVTYPTTSTDVVIDVITELNDLTGLDYEKKYTFKVVFTVADKNEKILILKESAPLTVEIETEKAPDHTYKVEGDKLTVAFNDGTNGEYPLYTWPTDLVLKEAKGSGDKVPASDNFIEVKTKAGAYVGFFEFDIKDKAFRYDVADTYEGKYEFRAPMVLTESDDVKEKNTISVLAIQKISLASKLGISPLGNNLTMLIAPPEEVADIKDVEMILAVYEGTMAKVDTKTAKPIHTLVVNYTDKKIVKVDGKTVEKSDLFDVTFPTKNVSVLVSLKYDTTYTFKAYFNADSPDTKGFVITETTDLIFEGKTAVDPSIGEAEAKKAAEAQDKLDDEKAAAAAEAQAAADKIAADEKAAADKIAADEKAAADKLAAAEEAKNALENSEFHTGDSVLYLSNSTEGKWVMANVTVAKNDIYTIKVPSTSIFEITQTLTDIPLSALNSTKHPANLKVGQVILSAKKSKTFFSTTLLGYFEAEITEVITVDNKPTEVYVKFKDGSDNKGTTGFFGTTGDYTLTIEDIYEYDTTIL